VTDPEQSLAGQVAFVTGGAGRIGSEIARTLAARGAAVVVADINGARAAERAAELVESGRAAFGVEVDIASADSIDAAFAAAVAHFGEIDVLVNNAAPTSLVRDEGAVLDVPLDLWETMMAVVLRGAFLCSRQVLGHFVEQNAGVIVNVASIHAYAGSRDITAYAVAKAGLLGLTRATATQYGRYGIRCNSVSPGTIPSSAVSEEWRRMKTRHQLIPREGRTEDVAQVVAFLASPEASFLTGGDYPVEGGLLAHLPGYADEGSTVPPA